MGRKKGEMKEIRKEMKNKEEESEFGKEEVREEEKTHPLVHSNNTSTNCLVFDQIQEPKNNLGLPFGYQEPNYSSQCCCFQGLAGNWDKEPEPALG